MYASEVDEAIGRYVDAAVADVRKVAFTHEVDAKVEDAYEYDGKVEVIHDVEA